MTEPIKQRRKPPLQLRTTDEDDEALAAAAAKTGMSRHAYALDLIRRGLIADGFLEGAESARPRVVRSLQRGNVTPMFKKQKGKSCARS